MAHITEKVLSIVVTLDTDLPWYAAHVQFAEDPDSKAVHLINMPEVPSQREIARLICLSDSEVKRIEPISLDDVSRKLGEGFKFASVITDHSISSLTPGMRNFIYTGIKTATL